MAEILFQLLKNDDGTASVDEIPGGSGLAFFGATAGSSVAIGSYQNKTYIANSTGTSWANESSNCRYLTDGEWPSGRVGVGGTPITVETELSLTGVKSLQGSLGIQFGHTSAVNVQNVQLRIYDRSNVNYPASGVNTKVAEIINHNGSTYAAQGTDNLTSDVVGSGDCFWWGEPWPNAVSGTRNYYKNSSGVTFYNGTDSDSVTNGDSRLSAAAVAGSYDAVGGTGVIVPLVNSPGSGQKYLSNHSTHTVSGSGMVWPKFVQYTDTTFQTAVGAGSFDDGHDGAFESKSGGIAPIDKTFGGTGVDTHHTWSVAISASPNSSGGKEDYGLYVSLEYY